VDDIGSKAAFFLAFTADGIHGSQSGFHCAASGLLRQCEYVDCGRGALTESSMPGYLTVSKMRCYKFRFVTYPTFGPRFWIHSFISSPSSSYTAHQCCICG
jgi:hypothetical protein